VFLEDNADVVLVTDCEETGVVSVRVAAAFFKELEG